MAWEASPGTLISDDVSVTGTTWADSSSMVSLNPAELCVIEIESDPPATPTNDLVVGVFPTLDGGTTYATLPVLTFTVSNSTDPLYRLFSVIGWPAFKLMYKLTGSTDTFTVRARARKDGVSA